MINLFISYYKDKNQARQNELDFCFNKNVNNKLIDKIFVITNDELPLNCINDKIKIINYNQRPTFKSFLDFIHSFTSKNDINIFCNSDIYFNETIQLVSQIKSNEVYCLTRWDLQDDNTIKLLNRVDSQDTWIFKGHIDSNKLYCDFYLGIPGCDNRFCYELKNAGYEVLNPSKTIQTIHYHLTQLLNYVLGKDKVEPPYKLLKPEAI